MNERKNFLLSDHRTVCKFSKNFSIEKLWRGGGLIHFFEDFGSDLANGHFEIAYFFNYDILSSILFKRDGVIKLGNHSPYDIHGSNAGLKIVVISEVEYFVNQVLRNISF